MATHFTGRIVVNKTTKTETPASREYNPTPAKTERETVEILDVTVRADTQNALESKLAGALALLDDEEQS